METWHFTSIVTFAILVWFLHDQNNRIVISRHAVKSNKLPSAFHGFKILHISDLHNKSFGKHQKNLLKKIHPLNVDIIVITGDLIDRRRTAFEPVLDLLEGLRHLPVYFVPGNHEAWSSHYGQLKEHLYNKGVHVLENEALTLTRDNKHVFLYGLKDPGFYTKDDHGLKRSDRLHSTLKHWNPKGFSILLSHRPEYFDVYASLGIDVSLSGHAHGGQIRFPFIGAILAPHQGFFPKYSAGMYQMNPSKLFLSRGLGNSLFPFRIFNQPELILLTLEHVNDV